MGQSGKLVIVILVILLIVSLAGLAIGFYSFQQERLRVLVLNKELEDLKIERRIIENELAESRRRNSDLEGQLRTISAQAEDLSSELEQTKSEKDQLYSQIQELQSRIQEEETTRKELEAKGTQAQEQIDRLQGLLKVGKDELGAQLNKFKTSQGVTLGKIVVEQGQRVGEITAEETPYFELTHSQASTALEGEVLVINKDYDFIVVSLGTQDGADIGDLLSVYHNDNYIGNVLIERAQKTISACAFQSGDIENIIKEGDRVIKK